MVSNVTLKMKWPRIETVNSRIPDKDMVNAANERNLFLVGTFLVTLRINHMQIPIELIEQAYICRHATGFCINLRDCIIIFGQ